MISIAEFEMKCHTIDEERKTGRANLIPSWTKDGKIL